MHALINFKFKFVYVAGHATWYWFTIHMLSDGPSLTESNITLNYLTKYWNKYWIIENWKLSVNVNDIHESKSKKKTVRIRNNKIFFKKKI